MLNNSSDGRKAVFRAASLGRYVTILAVAWTVVVGVSLAWNLHEQEEAARGAARTQAQVGLDKDVLYRRWNGMHGGLYAPVTEATPPNPQLVMPERDIKTPTGRTLTLVNPAYMTRQVHELGAQATGVQGHITSLNPIRPENLADPWETEALQAFERGAEEYSSIELFRGEPHFRLMRPLLMEEGCLQCHAEQGYRRSDVRGGISVSVPMAPIRVIARATMLSIAVWHGVFWGLGLGGIGLSYGHLRARLRERDLAEARAESATQAKSEFLANMSHEIRTPMTAILGFSDFLIGTELSREHLDAATTIKRNGEYLIEIINDILDLSKIEAGKLEVEQIPCSPCHVLSDVVSLMRVRAEKKHLPLEIEYDGPVPQTIRSDPTRLRQVLINLVGNAVKFTKAGKIRLVARLLNARGDRPLMQFDVVDSGIGMTEQQIANLFKPFQQADTSTARKFGGTGLGLTISKRLAENLGGDIVVTSTFGRGSTFSVTIATGPLDGVKLLENVTEAQLPADPDKKPDAPRTDLDCRVLLAEDGPDNQRLISFLLKKAGAEVAVADNGRIALDLALAARDEGNPFDVILMDMQMPVMDGYSATGELRQAGYAGPIIALTAHAMSTDRDKCLAAGCDDYATKPVDRKKLISIVAEYASRREPCEVDNVPD